MKLDYLIIGQVLTLVSYIVFWFSRFLKTKKDILLIDNLSRIIAIIGFVFLGTYDGIKNTVYVIFRNYLGKITIKKSHSVKLKVFVAMLLLLLLMYSFNFNGLATICIGICGILNLYGTIMTNEQGIRIYGMLGSIFYMFFMLFTGNVTGTVCEIICFAVMLISYIKYKSKKEI